MKLTETKLIDKMKEVEQFLASKNGEFALFALLEREDTPGLWDVVVSASWLGTTREDILTIAQQVTLTLRPQDMTQIARIVPVLPDSEFVLFLQDNYELLNKTGPVVRLGTAILSGIELRSGYILAASAPSTARRREAIAA